MQTILFPVCETDLSSVLPQYGLKAGLCSSAGSFRRSEFSRALEHFPKRLNRGIPQRERIGFKVRAGMEASMDGETVFGGSA
ncbi:MAG: hypothetical protein ABSE67_13970, partial [Xanthobacteraceae bacterium]